MSLQGCSSLPHMGCRAEWQSLHHGCGHAWQCQATVMSNKRTSQHCSSRSVCKDHHLSVLEVHAWHEAHQIQTRPCTRRPRPCQGPLTAPALPDTGSGRSRQLRQSWRGWCCPLGTWRRGWWCCQESTLQPCRTHTLIHRTRLCTDRLLLRWLLWLGRW